MAAPTKLRVSFGVVVDAIVQQIVSWPAVLSLNVTPDQVRVVAADDNPHTQGPVEVLVRIRRASVLPLTRGSGRLGFALVRRLPIAVWTANNLDPADRDYDWLKYAQLPLEEAIIDALLADEPTDALLNDLVAEPIRFAGSGDPTRERPRDGWGVSILEFDVPYLPPITESLQ